MPYASKQDLAVFQQNHRDRNKRLLWQLLATRACVDCDESDPVVLQFDHVRGEKKFCISKAVSGSTRSWTAILAEIEKCDVRCANCHIKVTARRGAYWRVFGLAGDY